MKIIREYCPISFMQELSLDSNGFNFGQDLKIIIIFFLIISIRSAWNRNKKFVIILVPFFSLLVKPCISLETSWTYSQTVREKSLSVSNVNF